MSDSEVLRLFALGMAAGHLEQARGEPRAEGTPGVPGSLVMPSRLEWMLGHARVALGWLVFAAERT